MINPDDDMEPPDVNFTDEELVGHDPTLVPPNDLPSDLAQQQRQILTIRKLKMLLHQQKAQSANAIILDQSIIKDLPGPIRAMYDAYVARGADPAYALIRILDTLGGKREE